jgi:hypothetical protein
MICIHIYTHTHTHTYMQEDSELNERFQREGGDKAGGKGTRNGALVDAKEEESESSGSDSMQLRAMDSDDDE